MWTIMIWTILTMRRRKRKKRMDGIREMTVEMENCDQIETEDHVEDAIQSQCDSTFHIQSPVKLLLCDIEHLFCQRAQHIRYDVFSSVIYRQHRRVDIDHICHIGP
uniref:Uncharacterized protein n=1 Tax=Cacopsylla melanoneura TaxID=428564 RepID=A0A8D9AX31_9HEMI